MTEPTSPFHDPLWPHRWSAREPVIDAIVPHLFDALNPRPGERILDVGTGAGSIAFPVAGAGAEVVAADISEPMISFIRARAAERGIANAMFLVADAASGSIPGAPFHAATSLFGVMFFPDPMPAFANIRRQLLPGARFVFACWTSAEDNPLHPDVLIGPSISGGWPLEGPDPGPFSLADVHHTRHLLASAGFVEIHRRRIDVRATVPREAVYGDELVEHLAPGLRRAALEAMALQITPFETSGGVRVPLAFQLYSATA